MATNQSFEYQKAEEAYKDADGPDGKLNALKNMLKVAPKHKSSEKLLASIKERMAKLKSTMDRQKKSGKRGYTQTIKKEGAAQVCIVGRTNSGKSTLLKELTGANVEIADYEFTTRKPETGTMDYMGIKIQIIEIPAVVENFEDSNNGMTYISILSHSDLVVMLFDSAKEKSYLDKELREVRTPRMVYNNEDKEMFSKKIWKRLGLIKVYTKQPGKEKDFPPVAFDNGSTVKDVAMKVHKDFIKGFKYARISGKSAKFDWQTVGLNHVLQDDDILELHMK